MLLIPLALIAAGVACLAAVNVYVRHWASQPLPIDEETTIVVAPGMAFAEVVAMLEELDVDPWPFTLRAQQLDWQKSVRSGEYGIVPGETADGLLQRLVRGDVLLHSFRIAEGSTVARLLQRLGEDERLHFDLAGASAETLMRRLGLLPGHAEGRFFPDTYLFPRGYRASELLRKAHAEMERQLDEAWRERGDVDLDDPYQALILASLVEKETAAAEDRGKVAGVFVRRLALDMRLQSDPTVIYGLGDAFDGDLTRAHLAADGAYNTYRRKGLPPTPIALPSRAAIVAAMNPEDGDALYFVARGDGTSEFSATLADHNAAVRRYQLR